MSVNPGIASSRYVFVAFLWLVPDRRIKRVLMKREKEWASTQPRPPTLVFE
ncbi:MAG: hypothetical protein ABSD57_01040 [Verrucomicrobiota bacterium]